MNRQYQTNKDLKEKKSYPIIQTRRPRREMRRASKANGRPIKNPNGLHPILFFFFSERETATAPICYVHFQIHYGNQTRFRVCYNHLFTCFRQIAPLSQHANVAHARFVFTGRFYSANLSKYRGVVVNSFYVQGSVQR